MAEFKHLVVAKFKEGVDMEQLLKGLDQLVSEIDVVHSFQWGEDLESHEMLRQEYTHVFLMTFKTKEDLSAFLTHPKHIEFSAIFAEIIDKFVVLDFPSTLVKPSAVPPQTNIEDVIPTKEKETTKGPEVQETT